jgi:hypothetical protein
MAGDSNFMDDESVNDRVTCSSCGKEAIQCYRVGCTYRLATAAKCVDCCPCGTEQAAKLKTAAAHTAIRLGV